ncbi:hypothetical protein OOJ91_08650 [Micromonospora lupini]|uniref:hypothetical protein n=1 Tax=Micromonospora lupini TaxID=285679 RepID=UPI00225416AC|nr:hypothetical protein [Micromonospora lupini]MCX5065951.1 hypothetical protein [Micromonospora lupini]
MVSSYWMRVEAADKARDRGRASRSTAAAGLWTRPAVLAPGGPLVLVHPRHRYLNIGFYRGADNPPF